MDAKEHHDEEREDDGSRAAAERQAERLEEDLKSAPPGSSIINSTRSGQMVSRNPVLEVGRDAGDVLADEVREEHGEEGGMPRPRESGKES